MSKLSQIYIAQFKTLVKRQPRQYCLARNLSLQTTKKPNTQQNKIYHLTHDIGASEFNTNYHNYTFFKRKIQNSGLDAGRIHRKPISIFFSSWSFTRLETNPTRRLARPASPSSHSTGSAQPKPKPKPNPNPLLYLRRNPLRTGTRNKNDYRDCVTAW